MAIVDANYILRWFLNDIPEQAKIADKLVSNGQPSSIYIDRVTIAEVTYVLRAKKYNHAQIFRIFDELYCYTSLCRPDKLTRTALEVYRDTALDFEDCLLIAFKRTNGYSIASFDKSLLKKA